jgi:hypothetical protein
MQRLNSLGSSTQTNCWTQPKGHGTRFSYSLLTNPIHSRILHEISVGLSSQNCVWFLVNCSRSRYSLYLSQQPERFIYSPPPQTYDPTLPFESRIVTFCRYILYQRSVLMISHTLQWKVRLCYLKWYRQRGYLT